MHRFLMLGALALLPAFGADPVPQSMDKVFDGQLKMVEREVVPLVEAMPEERFSFAPSTGEFRNVRTFAQQATHLATVNYMVAAAVLGEKSPVEAGENENGPATLKSKADIVKYVKDSFAYSHKAYATLTNANATGLVKSAFGEGQVARIYMANVALWHTFDHYGQMVIYARMNGVVPPASRR
jgi:hypothetical protein